MFKNSDGGTVFSYICNRQEFQDILCRYITEICEICGSCKKCSEWKKLEEITVRLDNAYFLKKLGRTYPTSRRCGIFFFNFRDSIHFYLKKFSSKRIMVIVIFLFNSVYTLIFRLIKMDPFKNLIDISSANGKIHDENDDYKTKEFDKTGSDIFNFLKPLEEVLFDLGRCYDHQRIVFINKCVKYPKVFKSMLQLKSKTRTRRLQLKI